MVDWFAKLRRTSRHQSGPQCDSPSGPGGVPSDPQCGSDNGTQLWRVSAPERKPLPVAVTVRGSGRTVVYVSVDNLMQGRNPTAKELAREFLNWLQTQGPLLGNWVPQANIRVFYYYFCSESGWPSAPYKDFARELALIAPRRRRDVTEGGKRTTWTEYYVPDPYDD